MMITISESGKLTMAILIKLYRFFSSRLSLIKRENLLQPRVIFFFGCLSLILLWTVFLLYGKILDSTTQHANKFPSAENLNIFSERDLTFLSQCQWIKYAKNPILEAKKGEWDGYAVRDPFVVKKDDRYFLFYHAYRGVISGIGLAISDDGFNFQRYGQQPILDLGGIDEWDSGSMQIGSILKIGGKYVMYYDGYRSVDSEFASEGIGIAESQDLYHWQKFSGNPIWSTSQKVKTTAEYIPFVVYHPENQKYYLYTERSTAAGWNIDMSVSADPYKFSRFIPNWNGARSLKIDLTGAANPKVYYVNQNHFLMGYNGFDKDNPGNLRFATSSDGLAWQPFNEGKAILEKVPGEWDGYRMENAFLLRDEDELKLYYFAEAAVRPELKWSIGVATCKIPKEQ